MRDRPKNKLRYIAELIAQNRHLEELNLDLQKQLHQLQHEAQKNKSLLNKQLLENTKNMGKLKMTEADTLRFKLATVMSADFVGFSKLANHTDSQKLVDNLDEINIYLDEIVKAYEVKNIKTIGDTILCVGGIPQKNMTNPIEVVQVALDMQYYMHQIQKNYLNNKFWGLCVGIHTGPITASISGKVRVSYDVKGENVNLASRIRAYSDKGKVIISETTYELVKDVFLCDYVGRMPVKYRGDILLYEALKIRPEYSLQKKGIVPNRNYSVRYLMIQFTDLQELILNKLEHELPGHLYYHNVKHTIDVATQVELIGIGEGVSDEELLLLKTAALFHDSGHILGYEDHEHYSTIVAHEILPDYHYTPRQIEKICQLIMVTRMPPEPQNKLEMIMCDADLDYLGRSDMVPVSNLLYRELKEMNKIGSWDDWNALQIKFISGHQYFTKTARSLREVNKQKQIDRLKSMLEG